MNYYIKMHAMYDHFPDRNPVDGEPYIDCYSDTYVTECVSPGKNIALLLEPKSMIGNAYKYVKEHSDYFKYIFTHDSELLTLPNAYYLNWADVWLTTDSDKYPKISICTSPKNWCPLHKARLELYNTLKGSAQVDAFYGDWNNPNIPTFEAKDYLENYMMSIIIENDIDDYWYTEKILNCFSTKTVPIYVGAPKIGEVFNADGIIQVDDWHQIPELVKNMDIWQEYTKRLEAIDDNFERVKAYEMKWKDRFFRDYGDMLEGLQNE